jgi:hypothetical protein
LTFIAETCQPFKAITHQQHNSLGATMFGQFNLRLRLCARRYGIVLREVGGMNSLLGISPATQR